jgi:hypothetical protein
MARERFLVARFDKRTGKQTEIVFSTLDKAEAERVSAKYNDDLSPRQRDKIEYRWQPGREHVRWTDSTGKDTVFHRTVCQGQSSNIW